MRKQIITIINANTGEWFFHNEHSSSEFGEDWVACTRSIPFNITPREGFEDGVIGTIEKFRDFQKLFKDENHESVEVINPIWKKFCEEFIISRDTQCQIDGKVDCCNCIIDKIDEFFFEDKIWKSLEYKVSVAERYLKFFEEGK